MKNLQTADAKIYRCPGCGGWVYGKNPCGTHIATQEATE